MTDLAIRIYDWETCPDDVRKLIEDTDQIEWIAVVPDTLKGTDMEKSGKLEMFLQDRIDPELMPDEQVCEGFSIVIGRR